MQRQHPKTKTSKDLAFEWQDFARETGTGWTAVDPVACVAIVPSWACGASYRMVCEMCAVVQREIAPGLDPERVVFGTIAGLHPRWRVVLFDSRAQAVAADDVTSGRCETERV